MLRGDDPIFTIIYVTGWRPYYVMWQ